MVDVALDLVELAQRDDGHHLRGDEEVVRARIVGGPEARPDHPGVVHRIPLAAVGNLLVRVGRVLGVILLALHRLERFVEAQRQVAGEDRRVAGFLPVRPRERDRIGQRIQLELLLPHAVVEREGVGVRIDLEVLAHPRDHRAQQLGDLRIALGVEQVRPHLGARVAQPLGRNVAGLDVGGPVAGDRRLTARIEQRRAIHRLELRIAVGVTRRRLGDRIEFQCRRTLRDDRYGKSDGRNKSRDSKTHRITAL